MNPYIIIAAFVVLIGSNLSTAYVAKDYGYKSALADTQDEVDTVNENLRMQKAEANALFQVMAEREIQTANERDAFKNKLGAEHVKNQTITNRLRNAIATDKLRFTVEDNRRCGGSGSAADPGQTDTTGNERATTIQLPEETARSLYAIAYDADQLADDYRLCYAYANGTP